MSTRFWESTYAKITFAVIFGTIGLVSAALVGRAILNRPVQATPLISKQSSESQELDNQYVNFGPGDLFPREPYWDADGQEGNFQDILEGKNTLVYFGVMGCGPCADELKFLREHMNQFQDGVQLIVVLRKSGDKTTKLYEGMLKGLKVVYYDDKVWADRYDFEFWPCLIGVDYSGFVQHVQLGFDGYLDSDLIQYFFNANQ